MNQSLHLHHYPCSAVERKSYCLKKTTLDHTLIDPKFQYKIKTYLIAIDSEITSIEDLFRSKSQELLKDLFIFYLNFEKNKIWFKHMTRCCV